MSNFPFSDSGFATAFDAIQEHMGYDPLVFEVFRVGYQLADGYLHPGEAPGLGVDVDEKAAAHFPYRQAYLPVARNLDGTMKDW